MYTKKYTYTHTHTVTLFRVYFQRGKWEQHNFSFNESGTLQPLHRCVCNLPRSRAVKPVKEIFSKSPVSPNECCVN